MKKFVKSILALTLVLAISFAFAGCKIVILEGKWTATEYTVEKYVYADDEQTKIVSYTTEYPLEIGAQISFEIKDGGTCVIQQSDYVEVDGKFFVTAVDTYNGTWKQTEKGVEIKANNISIEFEKQGSQLVQKQEIKKGKTKTVQKIVMTRTGK